MTPKTVTTVQKLVVISAALLGLSANTALAAPVQNCHLLKPPRDAGATEDHGFFFFLYPKQIAKSYDGCQIMWDERGMVLLTVMFQKGTASQLSVSPSWQKGGLLCQYKQRAFVRGSAKDCPDYESIAHGYMTIDKREEAHINIPKGRDPRK